MRKALKGWGQVPYPPTADNIEYFYECKKMNAYLDEDPLSTSLRLYLGMEKDDEAMEVVRHNLRIMQTYSKSSNVMKYLAISFKFAELNPGVKMYHILMQVLLYIGTLPFGKICEKVNKYNCFA